MRITALLACVAGIALVGAGCGNENRADIEVLYAPTENAPLAGMNVQLEGAGVRRMLSGEDFTTSRYATPHSSRIELPSTGSLRATVQVFEPGGGLLAEGSLTIPVEHDRRYGIEAGIRSENPSTGCLGCAKVEAFPLLASGASEVDSLYLAWGSNSISNPVIY